MNDLLDFGFNFVNSLKIIQSLFDFSRIYNLEFLRIRALLEHCVNVDPLTENDE